MPVFLRERDGAIVRTIREVEQARRSWELKPRARAPPNLKVDAWLPQHTILDHG